MQRKFILNLILIIFINLLIKPMYIFGVELHVQNLLGSENYGLYYSLFNLSFILSVIIDPGITNYNNRHIAQNEHLISEYFSKITYTKFLLSILYIISVGIYAVSVGFSSYEFELCALLVLGQIFNSFTLYNRSNLAGLHLFKTDTFISILDKLLMIILCAPILFFGFYTEHFNIKTFILLQTISFAGSALISFYFVKSHTNYFKFNAKKSEVISVLKKSYPFAILASLMLVYSKADTVLLKELHPFGNEQVGIYAAAYRLIDALNMIAVLFSGLLYPIFSKMIKDNVNLTGLMRTAFSVLVLPSLVFAIFGMMNAKEIMNLLTKNHFVESSEIFKIILFSFVFICNSYVFGTLLTANGNIRLLNKIALLAVIANFTLNAIFIPEYGALASAYTSLITFGLVSLLQLYFSFKTFHFKVNKLSVLLTVLSAILIILLYLFVDRLTLFWIYKLLLGTSGSILILWFCRLLPFRALNAIIKGN